MKKTNFFTAKRISLLAVLSALTFILARLTIKIPGLEFTADGLPVLIAGFILGPISGIIVAFIAHFLDQMLSFGFSPTTIFWVMPHMVRGLIAGIVGLKCKFKPSLLVCVITIIISNLIVTGLNTLVLYLDAMIFFNEEIYGMPKEKYIDKIVIAQTLPRVISSIATAILYCIVIPPLVKRLEKVVRKT